MPKKKKKVKGQGVAVNPFHRMHEPSKAGAVLVVEQEKELALQQFDPGRTIPEKIYRPIEISLPLPDPDAFIVMQKRSRSSPAKTPKTPEKTKASEAPGTSVSSSSGTSESSSSGTSGTSEAAGAESKKTMEGTPKDAGSSAGTTTPKRKSTVLGYTPEGRTQMKSNRSMDVLVAGINGEFVKRAKLFFFSPDRASHSAPPLKKKANETTTEKPDSKHKGSRGENRDKFAALATPTIKGDKAETIKPYRKKQGKKESNLVTMGISASQAAFSYLKENKENYSDHEYSILKQLIAVVNWEWLHAYGKGLKPVGVEVQDPKYLGAAPDYINTSMMVLEGLAKFFAFRFPVSILPKFTMLKDSHIIRNVFYEVNIQREEKTYTLSDTIDVIEACDKKNWPSFTDKPLAEAALEGLMTGQTPARETRLKR